MVARVVKYDEDGTVLYDGPARRGGDQTVSQKSNIPFGLTPADLVKLAAMFVFAVTFVVKTDQRLVSLEKSMEYISTFTKNADGWNSSLFGMQFEGGKPINTNFDMSKLHRQ